MIFLRQEGQDFVFGDAHGLVSNAIDEIGHPLFFAPFQELFPEFFLQDLGHPDHPFQATVALDELPLADVVLAVAHKARSYLPAADDTGQGGELHAAGGNPG